MDSVKGSDRGGVGGPPPRLFALHVAFAIGCLVVAREVAAVGCDQEAVGSRPGGVLACWLDRNSRE